jgi:hypothetical protein
MRRGEPLLPVLRLGFAASGVAAIAYQAMLKAAGVLRPGNFFSFFTIPVERADGRTRLP